VAPLSEQRRILAEIEKQFTRLEAGVVALNRVRANLKRYRAAVLKAAVEGRLVATEAELARREGRAYEPASELLKRILAERRTRWEADQLAKLHAAGNEQKDGSWKQRYKEPAGPDTANLPSLPDGWTWATVAQIGEVQLGRQRSPKKRSKDYPTKYIRAANITETGIDLTDVLDMEFDPQERERYLLRHGDIVLSEASGSPTQVGKPAIWRDELPGCCFQNTVIRLRPLGLPSEFPLVVFKDCYWNGTFAKVAGGVGINHLGADKFSSVPVPVPPLVEQRRIVAEVERRLSVIDELGMQIEANLKRGERLRQAILKHAFEGKLVPQDPNDEPASVLLERIRTEHKKTLQRASPRSQGVSASYADTE
jgi:type I restriction enzyme S subunit